MRSGIVPRSQHRLLMVAEQRYHGTGRFLFGPDNAIDTRANVRSLVDVVTEKHEIVACGQHWQNLGQQVLQSAQISVDIANRYRPRHSIQGKTPATILAN